MLGWAAAYATGVVPVDLPPITGPIPPIADVHLDNYQGLGPGLPMNVIGLPADDPLSMVPLVDLGRTDVASQIPIGPDGPMFGSAAGPGTAGDAADDAASSAAEPATVDAAAAAEQGNCAVFCIGTNPPAPVQPQLPPEALPPGIFAPPAAPAMGPPPPMAEIAPPPGGLPADRTLVPIGPQGVGPAPGPAPGPPA